MNYVCDLSKVHTVPDPSAPTGAEHGFGPQEEIDFAAKNVNIAQVKTHYLKTLLGGKFYFQVSQLSTTAWVGR